MSAPRHGRPGTLRFAAAAPHLARTMPWGALLAGCIAGLGVSLVAHQFSNQPQQPANIALIARAAFVPLVVAIAFVASVSQRDLIAALPAPAWLTNAAHLTFALPALGLTAWLQLDLAAADLQLTQGPGNRGKAFSGGRTSISAAVPHLPWLSLIAELIAWLAFATGAAAVVSRTRWAELAGAIGAPSALAFVGALALTPLELFPGDFTGLSLAQRVAWLRSDWSWCALGLAAIVITCWACRDPWRRLTRRLARPLARRARSAPTGT